MAINEDTYQHNSNCDVGCEEYVKTDCVVFEAELEYLGLEAGASTTEIINKLAQTVEYLQGQINALNAPSIPLNLVDSNITATTVDLSWDASTDRDGVATYNIYKDGVLEDNVVGTTANIIGLTTLTPYVFTVTAIDVLGNESASSSPLTITTI